MYTAIILLISEVTVAVAVVVFLESLSIKLPEILRTVPGNVIANRSANGVMSFTLVRKTRWKILPTVHLLKVLFALGILL